MSKWVNYGLIILTIEVLYFHIDDQFADIFTKAFCEKTFNNLKSLLGIADHAIKAWVETRFYNFVLQSMFKGGFSQVGFASFLVYLDMQYVKGD